MEFLLLLMSLPVAFAAGSTGLLSDDYADHDADSSDPDTKARHDDTDPTDPESGLQENGESGRVWGTDKDDTIQTGGGPDTLNGLAGDDLLNAGAGHDRIFGDAGNDTLIGRAGNDDLFGGADNDRLDAGMGDDLMTGGAGDDTILGGAGQDLVRLFPEGGHDLIYLGGGNDRSEFVSGLGSVSGVTVHGQAGEDYIDGTTANDDLRGDDGDDHIFGLGGQDSFHGGNGNDAITGLSGNDLYYGDSGNDVLIAGFGNDTLYGGIGNDRLNADGGNDLVEGGLGNDTIMVGTGQDMALGGDGNDLINGYDVTANPGSPPITGEGPDRLFGGDGNDTISGDDGDTLSGSLGADRFQTVYFDNLGEAGEIDWNGYDPVQITDFQPGLDRLSITVSGRPADPTMELVGVDGNTVVRFGTDDVAVIAGYLPSQLKYSDVVVTRIL